MYRKVKVSNDVAWLRDEPEPYGLGGWALEICDTVWETELNISPCCGTS